MRRHLFLSVALLASGCGEDGKVGSTSPPAPVTPPPRSDPAGPPRDAPPPRPSDPAPASAGVSASWAGTRAGDWATWRVLAEGVGTTRLTWRATKVEAGRVSFVVESTTTQPDGTVLSATRTEEVHDLAADASATSPVVVRGEARGEDVRVGAVTVPTTARVIATAQGDVQTWTSASVPFTGLVRAVGGGVDQSLQGFGRGP